MERFYHFTLDIRRHKKLVGASEQYRVFRHGDNKIALTVTGTEIGNLPEGLFLLSAVILIYMVHKVRYRVVRNVQVTEQYTAYSRRITRGGNSSELAVIAAVISVDTPKTTLYVTDDAVDTATRASIFPLKVRLPQSGLRGSTYL